MKKPKQEGKKRQIIISEKKHDLPYSKGLMASSIMATGLPPSRAYRIAKLIEDAMVEAGKFSVSLDELRYFAYETIAEEEGLEFAQKYRRWQAMGKLDKPMIILIGGTTGVGKSTIATAIAHRLGITHIVATDSLREVMRSLLSTELMPTLGESSFSAWRAISLPLPPDADPVIVGFREQVAAVSVGIKAVVDRAVHEGLNAIIEGVHVVPGFLAVEAFENAFVVQIIVHVEDEDDHLSHFYIRELQTDGLRAFERYRANFVNIRKLGEYILDMAKDNGIPVVRGNNFDLAVTVSLEIILNRVLGPVEEKSVKSGN
ncbi:MAG: 2-phosphoglycerate kinase [Actinobacteria bacterium]|nr:2-phosphoglycerate kinase [Actinomycetota bacterium]